MATSYTPLLGFALPVTGELQGTWGDTVNNSITQLCEDSIAGVATASVLSADWTLTTTGSGTANQSRMAILIPTGSPGVSRNIIAPSKSKTDSGNNQSSAAVGLKGSATTGVTITAGDTAIVAWNGSDFVIAAQVYPTAGVAVSTGSAWGTSLTAPTGALVGTSDTQTLTDKTVTNVVFDGNYTEEVYAIVDGASVDLNPANGTVQTWTLGASRSPTATGFQSGQSITLMIDDGSAYTITWPSVTWKTNAGVAPTLNLTGYTIIQLWKVGSVLYGARVGDA